MRILTQWELLDEEFDRLGALAREGSLHVAALTLGCLALALGQHEELDAVPPPPAAVGTPEVATALEFIRAHCHRELTVDDVARRVAISRRSLERRFAEAGTGTVARQISLARLERASVLLADGRLNVKEVGYAAGFGGPKRYIDAHRRVFGTTPGRERRA